MRPRRDTGSATVWVAGLLVVVVSATVLAVGGTAATAARHAAQLAADLAALAGAGRIGVAPGDVCAAATRSAAANGATVTGCSVSLDGPRTGEVRVEVRRAARWAGFDLDARARARAARVPAPVTGRPPVTASLRAARPCGSMIRAERPVPPASPTTRTVPPPRSLSQPAVPERCPRRPTWT